MLVFYHSLLLNVFECILPNDAEIFLLEPKGRTDKREEGAWASFTVLILSSLTVQVRPLNAKCSVFEIQQRPKVKSGGGGVM